MYNDEGDEAKSLRSLAPKVFGFLTYDVTGEKSETDLIYPFLEHKKFGPKARRACKVIHGIIVMENLCKLLTSNFYSQRLCKLIMG